MPADENYEGRLRELLRDPGWSLSPRPDAQARIQRSARRQRATITGLAACTGAAAVAAIAVPLALSGGGTQIAPTAAGHLSATPSPSHHATSVVMPNVTGMTQQQAMVVILSVTTRGHIVIVHINSTQTAGVVIRQVPAAGTTVSTDGQIKLTVPSS